MRGVSSVTEFTRIIRAHQAREQRRREKKEAKSAAHTKPKNGIIHGMKRHAKSALALTLAIAGGFAAPLRSAASPDIFFWGGGLFTAKLRSSPLRAA